MTIIDKISGNEIPETLFKFREANNASHLDILIKNELFFPSSKHFNDPFDSKSPIPLPSNPNEIEKYLDHILKSNSGYFAEIHDLVNRYGKTTVIREFTTKINDPKFIQARQNDELIRRQDRFGIQCLSSSPENILMWSHYSHNHTGICFGFDSAILSGLETYLFLSPIEYQIEFPKIELYNESTLEWAKFLFLRKHEDWKYENEWRLVLQNGANKSLAFPKEMIKNIYLGMDINPVDESRITHIIKKSYPSSTIIYKMRKSTSEYKLIPEKIKIV